MDIFDLTWAFRSGLPPHGGRIDCPRWGDIARRLGLCLQNYGTVGLEAENDAGESRTLQVRTENGNHLITMGLEIHGAWVVRAYNNPEIKTSDERVDILGDMWSAKIICRDWNIIVGIFKDFVDVGEIGNDNFG